jgi:hypothetical protein
MAQSRAWAHGGSGRRSEPSIEAGTMPTEFRPWIQALPDEVDAHGPADVRKSDTGRVPHRTVPGGVSG